MFPKNAWYCPAWYWLEDRLDSEYFTVGPSDSRGDQAFEVQLGRACRVTCCSRAKSARLVLDL